MNTGILKRCLEELSKESPRIDYVKGMLETLIEMQEPVLYSVPDTTRITLNNPTPVTVDTPLPPMSNLDRIKAIAEQSMQ